MIKPMISQRHFYFYKNWFVFPLAITWESNLPEYLAPVSRLAIHFLWWHWRWNFVHLGG